MNEQLKNDMIKKGLGFLDELYGAGFYEKLKSKENFDIVSNVFSSCIEGELFSIVEEIEKKITKESNTGLVSINFNGDIIEISRNLVTARISKRDYKGKKILNCYSDNVLHVSLNNDLYEIGIHGNVTKTGKSIGVSLKDKKNKNSEVPIKKIFYSHLVDMTVKNLMPEAELLRLLVKIILKSEDRGIEFLEDLKGSKKESYFDSKLKDFLEVELLYETSTNQIVDYNKHLKKVERRKAKQAKAEQQAKEELKEV